jgi:hypothetical protein
MLHHVKPAVKYIVFISLFAVLGFSREFLFVNINNQLYKLYYGHSSLPLPDSLSFIANIDYSTLYYSKFALTLVFYLAYMGTTLLALKLAVNDKKITRWAIYIYLLLLILAALSMLYNYLANNRIDGEEYTFSRWLLGIAQSPLVAFFMIASATLYKKFQTDKEPNH